MPLGSSADACPVRPVLRLFFVRANAPNGPAGPMVAASDTVAVIALCWPTMTVLGFTVAEVMLGRGFTVCDTGDEVMLALKSELPMNFAVIECGLAEDDSRAVVNVALPEPSSAALPISVEPSQKNT